MFIGRTDAKAETPILWPPHVKSWLIGKDSCQQGLGARGEGDDRGWDGWIASLTQWTWVWVNSGSWWWIRKPGVLRFMASQRVGHDWATELNWTEIKTNTPKWETKNEPQTNISYIIRQIISDLMEYTHISKVKTVQQKYSRLTLWTKEIKNYILQLRTKLTKAQTGK